MMQVKTIRPHGNSYGSTFQKAKDSTYDVDERTGKNLVAAGLVSEVKVKAAKPGDGKADDQA